MYIRRYCFRGSLYLCAYVIVRTSYPKKVHRPSIFLSLTIRTSEWKEIQTKQKKIRLSCGITIEAYQTQ